jgi:F0F1-type ATP synthase membrane subunit b/b'
MDAMLHALGGILLKAVPTFLLVIFLHFYLKSVFFKPLEKVLRQRYEATEGARKLAEESLERATAKTAEYQNALTAARSEIYRQQEKLYQEANERRTAQLLAARQTTDAAVKEARAHIAQDVEIAKASLARDTEGLATQIAESILRRSAA